MTVLLALAILAALTAAIFVVHKLKHERDEARAMIARCEVAILTLLRDLHEARIDAAKPPFHLK